MQSGNNNNNSTNSRNTLNHTGSGRVSPGGHRRTPNGRRSPNSYYERTTTVRLVQPSTGRLVCTKLNRVQRTKCKVEDGVCLCEYFLNGHCDNGSTCALAHVPKQYLWDFLTPRITRETLIYEEGFNIRCYTPNMDAYYDIPSEFIYATRGSEKYVELFNDNGDNFKEKCRLCEMLSSTGYCENGYNCDNVHCCVSDMSTFPCIHTHIADEEAVKNYERLPHTITVRVFQPNSGDEGKDFYGDDVLRTTGAIQYEEAFNKEGCVPQVKMQHCAHFQNKKLCRLGDGCRFLHVVSVALSTPMQEDTVDVSPRLTPVAKDAATAKPVASQASKNNAAYLAAVGMIDSMVEGPVNDTSTPYSEANNKTAFYNVNNTNAPATSMNIVPNSATGGVSPSNMLSNSSGLQTPNVEASTKDRRSPVRRHNPYATSPVEGENRLS